MTSGHLLQQLESEFTKVNERLQTSGQELQRLEAERGEKGSLLEQLRAQIAEAEQKRAELELAAAMARNNCPACATSATRPRRTPPIAWPMSRLLKSAIARRRQCSSGSNRWCSK